MIVLLAALAAGALRPEPAVVLCETGGSITECGQLTGVVITVDGPSLAQVDGFSLRTSGGAVLAFTIERLDLGAGGKPAAHLREHLRDGLPVIVDYKRDDGGLVALRYTDAN